MTEDLEMMRAAAATTDLSPEAISPLVVWLGSAQSRDVTGRVFGVWGTRSPCWRAGSTAPACPGISAADQAGLSDVIPGLLAKAAPNADTMGTRQPAG